jgi:hypothetical protein
MFLSPSLGLSATATALSLAMTIFAALATYYNTDVEPKTPQTKGIIVVGRGAGMQNCCPHSKYPLYRSKGTLCPACP